MPEVTTGPANEDAHYICVQHNDPNLLGLAMAFELIAYQAANPAATILDLLMAGSGAGNVFQMAALVRPDAGGASLDPANYQLVAFGSCMASEVSRQLNDWLAQFPPGTYSVEMHDFAAAGDGAVFAGAFLLLEIVG